VGAGNVADKLQQEVLFRVDKGLKSRDVFAFDLLESGINLTTVTALLDSPEHTIQSGRGPHPYCTGASQRLHAAPDRRMTSHGASDGEGQGGVGNGHRLSWQGYIQTTIGARKGRHRPANKIMHALDQSSTIIAVLL
jgi:hypothetical protein